MSVNNQDSEKLCKYVVSRLVEASSKVPVESLARARNDPCAGIPTQDNPDAQAACNYFFKNHGQFVTRSVAKGMSADEICSRIDFDPLEVKRGNPDLNKKMYMNEPPHKKN